MTTFTPTMLLCMAFVFIFWFLNEISVEFRYQTNPEVASKEAKRNNRYLMNGAFFCFVVFTVLFIINLKVSTFGMLPVPTFSYVGSLLAFFGILIRIIAIQTLKKDFDGYIQIKETQKLHTKGLYRWVRHPSYTGSILFFIGFGLSSLNIFTWALFTLFIFWIYHLRVMYEEKILLEAFGEEYEMYQRTTNAFFPTYKTIKHLGGKYDVQKSRNDV